MDKKEEQLARILKVLSVPARIRILQFLKSHALCVNALTMKLDITQSAVSQHLRILRDAGLVIDEKRGYYVHYRVNEKTLEKWQQTLQEMFNVKSDKCNKKKGAGSCAAAKKIKKNV